jgi:hypothetical protein
MAFLAGRAERSTVKATSDSFAVMRIVHFYLKKEYRPVRIAWRSVAGALSGEAGSGQRFAKKTPQT